MNIRFSALPEELLAPAQEILTLLPFAEALPSVTVAVSRCEKGFVLSKTAEGLCLSYAEKSDFFRGLTYLDQVLQTGETVDQTAAFDTLCYMIDVSRNAVLNLESAYRLIRYLAMMGYNSLMLYTEDTYEIPEYPYFGHMRGRYTQEELRAMDDYADSFGIELIPCIQTLAHLKSALRWECFSSYSDNEDILLADDPRTYELIDRMFASVSSCFRSKRIHIGMDEAHGLGLGKYLSKHGYRNPFEILSGHLVKVKEICDKYGLKPMIWSDMYFRLYGYDGYYTTDGTLPDEVFQMVPEGVGVVYWDYYTEDLKRLDNMFENHKRFGELIFAGGTLKSGDYAPLSRIGYKRGRIHADGCLRHGCKVVIVTGWSDNGAEASQFSTFPALLRYAESCYDPSATDDRVAVRFKALFGIEMEAFMKMDYLSEVVPGTLQEDPTTPSHYMLFNGVLGGLMDAHIPENISAHYLKAAKDLLQYADHPAFGYMFATLGALCYVLEKKASLSVDIRRAYEEGKKDVLRWYAEKEIPEIIARIDDFLVLHRQQWYIENKTFGFDVHDVRMGGLKELLRSSASRLKSYCNGEVDRIEELEQPVLPYHISGSTEKPSPSFYMCDVFYAISAAKFY